MSAGGFLAVVKACIGGLGWQHEQWLNVLHEWHVLPSLGVHSLAPASAAPSQVPPPGDDGPTRRVSRPAPHSAG